eukprot:822769-Alexandrium_andersonii.AAC.1
MGTSGAMRSTSVRSPGSQSRHDLTRGAPFPAYMRTHHDGAWQRAIATCSVGPEHRDNYIAAIPSVSRSG